MDDIERLEAKIDRLTECLYGLCAYIEEQAKTEFDRDVSANIVGAAIFESMFYPDSFFGGERRG